MSSRGIGLQVYTFTIHHLKLPTANVILHEHHMARHRRTKILRVCVETEAKVQGLGQVKPLPKASVGIVVAGPYNRRAGNKVDADNIWIKDLLDAIVARQDYAKVGSQKIKVEGSFRWGLIADDSQDVIGKPKVEVNDADEYSVTIGVAAANP